MTVNCPVCCDSIATKHNGRIKVFLSAPTSAKAYPCSYKLPIHLFAEFLPSYLQCYFPTSSFPVVSAGCFAYASLGVFCLCRGCRSRTCFFPSVTCHFSDGGVTFLSKTLLFSQTRGKNFRNYYDKYIPCPLCCDSIATILISPSPPSARHTSLSQYSSQSHISDMPSVSTVSPRSFPLS